MSLPRPRLGLVASVAGGGAVGSLARYGLSLAMPAQDGLPVSTLTANLVGAFLLGLLLQGLTAAGPETPARRWVRLTFGTGLLGGFTTYSSLALEVRNLFAAGRAGLAFGYGIGSVAAGFLACAAGIVLATRRARSHETAGGDT